MTTLTRAAMAAGIGYIGYRALKRFREADLEGRVVLVTGASRGLGFLLARRFADEGAKLVICARDPDELSRALDDLEERGAEVLAVPCDVTSQAEVEEMVALATERFGHVDVLVNNAGIIQVGPVESLRAEDFERAVDTMYLGTVYPTLAVLPQMIERGSGRIVNITSLGGFVSVPHLLPYSAAKFAAVGFSQGLRAELSRYGIPVTTVAPATMRVGSYLHAEVRGEREAEYRWFSLLSSLPFVSTNPEHAARAIVRASKRGDAVLFIGRRAMALAKLNGIAPGLTADLLGIANRLLPSPVSDTAPTEPGWRVEERLRSRLHDVATGLGRRGAHKSHQYVAP